MRTVCISKDFSNFCFSHCLTLCSDDEIFMIFDSHRDSQSQHFSLRLAARRTSVHAGQYPRCHAFHPTIHCQSCSLNPSCFNLGHLSSPWWAASAAPDEDSLLSRHRESTIRNTSNACLLQPVCPVCSCVFLRGTRGALEAPTLAPSSHHPSPPKQLLLVVPCVPLGGPRWSKGASCVSWRM